jgi:hypothetical protein
MTGTLKLSDLREAGRQLMLLATAMVVSSIAFSQEIQSVLPGFVVPKPDSDYDRQLLDHVKKIGWYHVHVQAEGQDPAFAFSLGFYANYDHPEIIVIGLKPATAQQLLNIAAISIAGAKSRYETYKPYDDIAEGMRIAFVPVADKYFGEYFGYGRWFYQSKGGKFPALQMVWPDKKGLLPWEAGYDAGFKAVQPLLDK